MISFTALAEVSWLNSANRWSIGEVSRNRIQSKVYAIVYAPTEGKMRLTIVGQAILIRFFRGATPSGVGSSGLVLAA